jgi:FMN phosphatase YigB (HAD superfamily)
LSLTRGVIFDFIGTLASVKDYSMEESKRKLHEAIQQSGFNVDLNQFLEAYSDAHEKYRLVRYGELVEVTNAIWISEALNKLGFKTTPEDECVRIAVNVFFKDYVNSLELRPCTKQVLEQVSANYIMGLISNFTYAPVIYYGLRKLDIAQFFNAILVSEEVGWRKPNRKIFEEALKRLKLSASETVYIGDSPLEDIAGAKSVGMKTIFVPSQFYSLEDLRRSKQQPELIAEDMCRLQAELPEFLKIEE